MPPTSAIAPFKEGKVYSFASGDGTYTPHTLYVKGIMSFRIFNKMESVRVVILVCDMRTQCPLHIGEVSCKYLTGF